MATRRALVIGSETNVEIGPDYLAIGAAGILSSSATWQIGAPGDTINFFGSAPGDTGTLSLHGSLVVDGTVTPSGGFTDIVLTAQPAGGGQRSVSVATSAAGLDATDLVIMAGQGGTGSGDDGGDVLLVPGAPVAPSTTYGRIRMGNVSGAGSSTAYELLANTGAGTLPGMRYNDSAAGTGAKTWQKLQGSGAWAPLGNVAPRRLRVGTGDDVEYTSIASALSYAISQGGVWEITVRPGTYTEPPMSLAPGIVLSSDHANRVDEVFVVASNPAADLFTCTGGYICGLNISGVTDPAYALIRCATASTLTVLHGVSFRKCSNGLVVSGGASAILTNFSINLTGAGQAVTTGITVTGANSYVGVSGMFLSVPAALLPAYSGNPLQTGIYCTAGAELLVASAICRVAPKFTTPLSSVPSVFLADGGARVNLLSTDVQYSGIGAHIGASGSSTKFIIQGASFFDNVRSGYCESSTGAFLVAAASHNFNFDMSAGGSLTGLLQLTSDDTTHLAGNLEYTFTTSRSANLADFFSDNTSTGVCEGGAVSDGGGLTVDVDAGEAWIVRASPDHDSATVDWTAVTGLALSASATNYVLYDYSGGVQAQTGAPGSEQVLLQTVVTDGSGIRFLHNTRTLLDSPQQRIQSFLYSTIKSCLKSGLGAYQGSTAYKMQVDAGSYYLGLTPCDYAGSGGDATWSYFYGTNGATEVSGVSTMDATYYDNAGTLTAMTAGYFRSDTVLLTSDGRLSIIYGTAEYSLQADAEAASVAGAPTFIDPSSISLMRIVVQQGAGAVSWIDARPRLAAGGGGGGGGGGSILHSTLLGLPAPADDHTQYLLCSGVRAMSGDLNMGGYDIASVGTVAGVVITAHAARHNPGGADALAAGTPVAVLVGAAPAQGTGSSYALNDHQHGVAAGVPGTVTFGSAAAGSASSVARSDHVHALTAPGNPTTVTFGAASPGTSANVAREDHVHALTIPAAPANVTKAAAAAGTSANVAREDHKHDVSTAAPGTVTFGAASEGTATSLARSDHAHALTAPVAPANVTKAAADAGTSANVAREDHKHDVSTAAPVSTGAANAEGTASTLARSDHVHLALPVAAQVTASTQTTTTSPTDVVMSGMTATPAAGTYLVFFTGDLSGTNTTSAVIASVYAGGVLQPASQSVYGGSNTYEYCGFCCVAIVTVNGSQAIEGRWRVTTSTGYNNFRSLTYMRVL